MDLTEPIEEEHGEATMQVNVVLPDWLAGLGVCCTALLCLTAVLVAIIFNH